jgi:arginyl-tRNA synthetase
MITRDLRDAIGEALDAGHAGGTGNPVDPGLRPGGGPGQYSSSAAFTVAKQAKRDGATAEAVARTLAASLREQDWISQAEVTGPGYVTITVTPRALVDLPRRMDEAAGTAGAGPDAVARSDALRNREFPVPETGAWEQAPTWELAWGRLRTELTGNLAAAAGGTVVREAGKSSPAKTRSVTLETGTTGRSAHQACEGCANEPAPLAAVAFAGTDAVKFALARTAPGASVRIDQRKIARQHPGNPAYAVRYAHARAVSGLRWAVALGTPEAGPQWLPANPVELTLLDALSWLPERVAMAARRGRPDEFARYLERVADVTLATLTSPNPSPDAGRSPGSDTLALATAARTGLAAGLALLGVDAPDRL